MQEQLLKKLIISVSGSWHGSVNELLFTPNSKLQSTYEGLEKQAKKYKKFIPYNNIELSKKILKNIKKIMRYYRAYSSMSTGSSEGILKVSK